MDDLLTACKTNFAILLDAYLTGANAVYFKGDAGTAGMAGLRGASMFQLTRNNLLACYNALQLTDGFETVYSDADRLVKLVQQAIDTNPDETNSAFRQCFADIEVIDQLNDLVQYDMLLIDNGFILSINKSNDKYIVSKTGINLLTTTDYSETIAALIKSLITEQSSVWHFEQSKVSGSTSTSEAVPESADGAYVAWNKDDSMMWLAIVNTVDAAERQYSPVIFTGSTYDLKRFYSNLVHSDDDALNAPIMADSPVFAVKMRAGSSSSTDDKAPSKYGLVILDEAGGLVNGKTFAGCNASVTYDNGRLWIEVEKKRYFDDMPGKLFISKQLVKIWTGENGLQVIGANASSVSILNGNVTASNTITAASVKVSRSDMRDCMVKCDATGNLIPASGSSAVPVPIGTIIMWPGENPPDYDGSSVTSWTNSDWRICDGSKLLVANYPKLASVLNGAFGIDGPDRFYLPDMRASFALGAAKTGTTFGSKNQYTNKLGDEGGAHDVSLTAEQLPAHAHAITPHTHTFEHVHNVNITTGAGTPHKHAISVTCSEAGAHTHIATSSCAINGEHTHIYDASNAWTSLRTGNSSNSKNIGTNLAYTSAAGAHAHSISTTITSSGMHGHTVSGSSDNESTHTHTVAGTTAGASTTVTSSELNKTNNAGSGQTHSNMPCYVALYYIIKVSNNH